MGLELGNSNAMIKWNSSTQEYEHFQKPIRKLIVNDSERFRLEIKGKLWYAKGKINLVLNNKFLDSNGEERFCISPTSPLIKWMTPTNLFCFYNDGFYLSQTKTQDRFSKYYTSLSDIVNHTLSLYKWSIEPIVFQGWYFLSSNGIEYRIDSIEDVYKKTDLFKYKKDNSLPEITLYGKWKIPSFKLFVHNITRFGPDKKRGESSFYNKQEKKTIEKGKSSKFDIICLTNLNTFVKNNISEVKYITWAYDALDGCNKQQKLREGAQKFLGWAEKEYVYDSNMNNYRSYPYSGYTEGLNPQFYTLSGPVNWTSNDSTPRIDIYPQFETIVIFKKANFNGYYLIDGPSQDHVLTDQVWVKTVGGDYLLYQDAIRDYFVGISVDNEEVFDETEYIMMRASKELTKANINEKYYNYDVDFTFWRWDDLHYGWSFKKDYTSSMVDTHHAIPLSSTIVFQIHSRRGPY